jgi:histidinol-phosphate aminotransferase
VVFTRPKALNALTLGMIEALAPTLAEWAKDNAVRQIVQWGDGGKAFCAGGDVRAIVLRGAGGPFCAGADVADLAAARARLAEAVAALANPGLNITPSEANFLLVHFAGMVTAAEALDALGEAGYAVRHLPGQGLHNALRITIGKSDDMTRVISTFRILCGEAA